MNTKEIIEAIVKRRVKEIVIECEKELQTDTNFVSDWTDEEIQKTIKKLTRVMRVHVSYNIR